MWKEIVYYLWSLCRGGIHLSLFWLGVNNKQNAHSRLSSFRLSLSVSSSHFVDLTQCAHDDDGKISFSYVGFLPQINTLISSDLGVRLCKLLFIRHIDFRAAGIKILDQAERFVHTFEWNAKRGSFFWGGGGAAWVNTVSGSSQYSLSGILSNKTALI